MRAPDWKPKLIACALLIVSAACAYARDSTWLLGDNSSLAITTFEHRAGDSDRETNVTLLIGIHFLTGKLRNADAGSVKLVEQGGDRYTFAGRIKIDYENRQVALRGKLSLGEGATEDLDTTFDCKELSGL